MLLLPIIALIVAFCSIVYELLLAQTLSALLGNSILRYSITIGLFLFSLGIGALILDIKQIKKPLTFLFRVEVLLSIIGCLSPALAFCGDAICQMIITKTSIEPSNSFIHSLNYLQSHIWIFVIGILSGFEIPLLLQIAREHPAQRPNNILAIDYLGTVIGAIAFPLLLLPVAGLVKTAFFTGMLNLFAAILLLTATSGKMRVYRLLYCLTIAVFILLGITHSEVVHNFIINNLFFSFYS